MELCPRGDQRPLGLLGCLECHEQVEGRPDEAQICLPLGALEVGSHPVEQDPQSSSQSAQVSPPLQSRSPQAGGQTQSYRNHVHLECNGAVLVDQVFTSRAACQAAPCLLWKGP